MAELFDSATTQDRLPAAIRGLGPRSRRVFILMRLRKTPQQIAGQLSIPYEEAEDEVDRIRHALVTEGLIDLVEEPEHVSIHPEGPDDTGFDPPSTDMELDDRIMLKRFLEALSESVKELPHHRATLLRLRYRDDLSGGEIVSLARKTGIDLTGVEGSSLREQDIYPALTAVLKDVLQRVKGRIGEESTIELPQLKGILEWLDMDVLFGQGVSVKGRS
jgi:DNA-directed RNA polymerase specialized sigma24 family protein